MISLLFRSVILALLYSNLDSSFATEVLSRKAFAMGTSLQWEVEASSHLQALEISEKVHSEVNRTERRLSTWGNSSELATLNHLTPGQKLTLSKELGNEIELALACSKLTDGYFHPALGSLMQLWNMRKGELNTLPTPAEIRQALLAINLDHFRLREGIAERRHPEFQFEEGGFGKGAALDYALNVGKNLGAKKLYLNFGGQMAWFGESPSQIVSLSHPLNRETEIAKLSITGNGSVSTSGSGTRTLHVGTRHFQTILNPKTGSPIKNRFSSIVFTYSAFLADCISTALIAMDYPNAVRWVQEHPEFASMLIKVDHRNREHFSVGCGFQGALQTLSPNAIIHNLCQTKG